MERQLQNTGAGSRLRQEPGADVRRKRKRPGVRNDAPEEREEPARLPEEETGPAHGRQRNRPSRIPDNEGEDPAAPEERPEERGEEDSGEKPEDRSAREAARRSTQRSRRNALHERPLRQASAGLEAGGGRPGRTGPKRRHPEETPPEAETLDAHRDAITRRRKRQQTASAQRRPRPLQTEKTMRTGRLSFADEKPGLSQPLRGAGSAAGAAAEELGRTEDKNSGTDAARDGERLTRTALRGAPARSVRPRRTRFETGAPGLRFEPVPAAAAEGAAREARKREQRRFYRKQRVRRRIAAARSEEKTAELVFRESANTAARAAAALRETLRRSGGVLAGLGVLGLLFLLMAASVTSCTAVIHGTGSSVIATTYASTDEEIYRVENAYRALEQALQAQLGSVASRYPGYGAFRYQIDEISHNPYSLISYFTVKYGEFTLEQTEAELEEIFRAQYAVRTASDTVTERHTRMVRVGQSLGPVVTSGYCSCPICCGAWSGGPTASGVYPTAAHTVAVDAAEPFVPMGTHVVMNGVEYVVEDTGGFARYGVQFDVYYDSHTAALNHGHQVWEAYLADSSGRTEVPVTVTESVNRLSVTLTNRGLDEVLRARLNADGRRRFAVYNRTFGNRNYLFDLAALPASAVPGGYAVPPEALSDERFARMLREAEQFLGLPYVWGGSSPETGFDCSGFVSWVVNRCGNGWSVGRQTAEGLRQCCAYVAPEEARPGDLVFFQGTYDCAGASHCGIYVGDGWMIHCGNPVQYANLRSEYWQNHFYEYGRLP